MQRFNFDDADDYNENNFGSALLLFSNVSSQLILLSIISRILTVFNCGDNLLYDSAASCVYNSIYVVSIRSELMNLT